MKRVILLFNRLFVSVPIGLALVLALIYIAGGWGIVFTNYPPEHFYLPILSKGHIICFILMIVLVSVAITACIAKARRHAKNQLLLTILTVFSIAMLLRLILPILFKDYMVPFSDYERVWELTHGKLEGNIEYYTLFPAYLNYSVLQRLLIKLFGDSYITIIYANALMGGITSVVVAFIAYEIWKDSRWALVAGLIYSAMPSGIIYTMIGGPDLFTICLNSLGVLIVIWASRQDEKKRIVSSIFAGVLLGLGASYKSFAIIIIIAIVMTCGVKQICSSNKKDAESEKTSHVLVLMLCTILLLAGYVTTKTIVLNHTEEVFDRVLDERTATPHFLLVGLNTQGEGQISEGDLSRQYYQYYLDNNQNYYEAKEYAYNILKEDWGKNTSSIPKLFIKKTIWAWQDDVRPALYLQSCIDNHGKVEKKEIYSFLEQKTVELSQAYYIMFLISSLAGGIAYAKKKRILYSIELIELIIFGYFCLIMLSEAQSRYKMLILPYMCIISCMGIKEITEAIGKKKGRLDG